MSDLLIDLPYHKRWILPDGKHYYNTVIYGDTERISVIRMYDHSTVFSHRLKISDPQWEQLSGLAQDLANKRFPKELRHKRNIVRAKYGL